MLGFHRVSIVVIKVKALLFLLARERKWNLRVGALEAIFGLIFTRKMAENDSKIEKTREIERFSRAEVTRFYKAIDGYLHLFTDEQPLYLEKGAMAVGQQ